MSRKTAYYLERSGFGGKFLARVPGCLQISRVLYLVPRNSHVQPRVYVHARVVCNATSLRIAGGCKRPQFAPAYACEPRLLLKCPGDSLHASISWTLSRRPFTVLMEYVPTASKQVSHMHLFLHRYQCANRSQSSTRTRLGKKPHDCTDPLVTSNAEEATNETSSTVKCLPPGARSKALLELLIKFNVSSRPNIARVVGTGDFTCLMGANYNIDLHHLQ